MAAPVSAYGARLVGQVIGPPYAAKKGTAVLVLLTPKSSRRAKLKSRIGELRVVSKTVKLAGGRRTAAQRVRVNDRFRARARVRRGARRAAYWQLTSRRLMITKRAATLSAAELQELVEGLRADLSSLTETVEALARYTAAEFQTLRADLASVRAELDALRSDFTALSAQLAATNTQLAALAADVAALAAELDALQSDLADLSADLAALTATVGALSGRLGDLGSLGGTVEELLSGVAPGALADALADIATLQGSVTALQADVDVLCGPTSLLDALC